MTNILWFKDISKKDLHSVGGKGANLGELFESMPIPKGFCITVDVFESFIEQTGLKEEIYGMLQGLDIKNQFDLDTFSAEIREKILNEEIQEDIKKEIIQNYKKLGKYVAVRSSATAEDLPNASFAGQQDTYLNVKGEDEVIKAVKECWASLFNSRAIIYRETKGFNHDDVQISVIIQEMIDSEKAGVIFTVNPVNQNKNEMIIEGNYGLGETVVLGQVTPDTYTIMKTPFNILAINIGSKSVAILKGKDGKNVTIKVDEPHQKAQLLNEKELKGLVDLATKIEEHYKEPQDIEWGIVKKKIYILQSRPITTLN